MPGQREMTVEDVLGDDDGREVDFHVIVLAEDGRGLYGPSENGEFYPAQSLTGVGVLAGRDVACIAPEWQVAFRTGYDVDEDDWADVSALCAQFGIAVPDEYQPFDDRSLSDGR